MSRTLTASAIGAAQIVMFPNGCRFDNNDVFVGSGFLESLVITHIGVVGFSAVIGVYDAIVTATQKVLVGGTGTQDQYRVIAANAAGTNGPLGDPISFVAPNAQLTACRQVVSYNAVLDAAQPRSVIPINIHLPNGMAVYINAAAGGSYTIAANFIPHVSGGARRRRGYAQGSTTKIVPLATASL